MTPSTACIKALRACALGAEPARGYYNDRPGALDDVVRAFARGTRMTVDLTDRWDFWAVMDRPVEALRREYGIEAWV